MESNDILHYRGRLYVPKPMIPMIFESEHDRKVGRNFRQEKMTELVRQNFSCPEMDTDITKYNQACPDC